MVRLERLYKPFLNAAEKKSDRGRISQSALIRLLESQDALESKKTVAILLVMGQMEDSGLQMFHMCGLAG